VVPGNSMTNASAMPIYLLCGYCFLARRNGDAKAEIRRVNRKTTRCAEIGVSMREYIRKTQPMQQTSSLSLTHGWLTALHLCCLANRQEHTRGLSLEFGDLGIAELFLLSLQWHVEQSHHLKIFE
jgi:hypothetical protein